MSDRICLMNHAKIEQLGTPREIYEHPASLFAADFIGISNVLRGRIGAGVLETVDGPLPLPPPLAPGASTTGEAALVIRPEHVELTGPLRGRITESVYAGSEFRLIATLPSGATLVVRRSAGQDVPAIGDEVSLGWDAARARLLTR